MKILARDGWTLGLLLSLGAVNLALIYALTMVSVSKGEVGEDLRSCRRHQLDTEEMLMYQNLSMQARISECVGTNNVLLENARTALTEDEKGWLSIAVVVPREERGDGSNLEALVESYVNSMPPDILQKEGVIIHGALSTVLRLRVFYHDSLEDFVRKAKLTAHLTAPPGSVIFEKLHDDSNDPMPQLVREAGAMESSLVQRQFTRDLSSALRALNDRCTYVAVVPLSAYICPGAFEMIIRAVSHAGTAISQWSSVLVSSDPAVLVFRHTEVASMAEFMYNRQHSTDAMSILKTYLTATSERGGRFGGQGAVTYRYNLFTSNFEACFTQVSTFDGNSCGHEYSPCPDIPSTSARVVPERGSQPNVKTALRLPGRAEVVQEALNAPPTNAPAEKPGDPKVVMVVANRGESCNQACTRSRLHCDEKLLETVNNCESLRKYFPCQEKRQCDENEGDDQPAYDASSGLCLVKRRKVFSCYGSHPKTQRICGCTSEKGPSQFAWQRQLKK